MSERGAATVEHAGLVLLLALLFGLAIVAVRADPPGPEARELGTAIARKLRCGPRLPGPCWRDPLTEAYGRPLAGVVRALAPAPTTASGLLPVDFRYCRSQTCALPGLEPGLTASNRRVTAFTSAEDRRRDDGTVRVTYWLYRPGVGWDRITRTAGPAEVAAYSATPLLETSVPTLVPLETLAGRNHFDFPAAEEPPWRWQVQAVYP